jgi:D-alanyl-D-alanine carboxypeptidase/D-alanyl-D-alanine-endopeptidase (penicillin-binding protein 4)
MKLKICVSVFVLLVISSSNFAQTSYSQVANNISEILKNDFFKSTQISIDVFDLTENKPVYEINEKLLLKPASNMKILTTAAALYFLKPEYKFKTTIWMNGEIEDSVLLGDLYFQGGFDPDFTYEDLQSLIKGIKQNGIKQIAGNVCIDISNIDSLFWGEGWMWDDEPSTDFPYLTSLVIDDNAVSIISKPGANIGEQAIIEFLRPSNFDLINNTETVSSERSRLYITRDWINRNNTVIVSGKVNSAAKPDTTSISIFNPYNYFLFLINELMQKSNINVEGEFLLQKKSETSKLISTFERPFSEIIINLNKMSDNLSAEMTLRALGFDSTENKSSAENGIKFIDSLVSIIGFDPVNYRFADGSGVSHYNLITTELIVGILKYFYQEKKDLFKILYESFPVAGIDGTLKNRMKNTSGEKNVHAKTGTLSGVSSLSGYLTSKSGHMISFSIFEQNYIGSSSKAREIQDKICNILIEGI